MSPLHCLLLLTLAAADVPASELEVPTKPQDYRGPGYWATPAPDAGIDVGFVPQRLYAQVRHSSTVRHLPRSAALAEASTPEEVVAAPRLREVVRSTKLSEVYSEEGYEDSAYDHAGYDKNSKQEEDYETKENGRNKSKPKSRPRSQHDDRYDDSQSQGSNPQSSEIGAEGERQFPEAKIMSPTVKRKIVRKSNLFVEMEDKGYGSEPRRMAAEYITTIRHPFSIVPESIFHDPTTKHKVSDGDFEKTVRHSPRSLTRRLTLVPAISTSTTASSDDVEALERDENRRRRLFIRERRPDVNYETDSNLGEENVAGINDTVPNVPNDTNSYNTSKYESQENYRGYYEGKMSRKPLNATAQHNYRIIQRRKPVDIQLDTAHSVSSADPRSNWNLSPHRERDPLSAVSQMETYDWLPRPFKPAVYSTAIQDRSDSSLPTANYKNGEIPLIPMQLPDEPDEIIIVIKSKSGDSEGKKDSLETLTSADSSVQQWNSSPYSKHPTLPLESRVLKALQEHVTSETHPLSTSVSNTDAASANKQANTRYPNRGLHSARYRATLSTSTYKSTTIAPTKATEISVPSEYEKGKSSTALSSKGMSLPNNETELKLDGINSTVTVNYTKNETITTDSTFADQFSISNFWAPIKKLVENNIPIVKYVPRQDYSQVNEKIENTVQLQTNISGTLPKVTKLTRVKASLLNFKEQNNTSASNMSHNASEVQGDAFVGLNRENRDTIFNTSTNMYNGTQTQDEVVHSEGEENNSKEGVNFGERLITGKQGKYDKVINRRPVLKINVSDNGYEADSEIKRFIRIPLQNRSDYVQLRSSLVQGREKRNSGNPKYLNSEEEDKRIESEIEEIDKTKEKEVFEDGKEWEEAIRLVDSTKPKQQFNNEKYPFYKKQAVNSLSIHSPLRYALNPSIVPRKTDGGMEFYESRESIQCPEVSPNLSDVVPKRKSQGEWNKEPRPRNLPRLHGLGDKLDCLKVKYWGDEPLDNPFFTEDSVEGVEKSKSGRFERVASDEDMDFFADIADAVESIKHLGRQESKSWSAGDIDSSSSKQILQGENVNEERSKLITSLGVVPNSRQTNEPTKSYTKGTLFNLKENCKTDALDHSKKSGHRQLRIDCHADKSVPKPQLSSVLIDSKSSTIAPTLTINVPRTKFDSTNERIIGLYPPPIPLYHTSSNNHTRVQGIIKPNDTVSSIPIKSHTANDEILSDYMAAEETVPMPVAISEKSGDAFVIEEESYLSHQGGKLLQNYEKSPSYETPMSDQERNRRLNHYFELLSAIQRSQNSERRPDSDHNASDRSYNRVWSRGSAVNKDERTGEHSKSTNDQRRGEPRYSDEGGYEKNILHTRKNPEGKREHSRRNKTDYKGGETTLSTAGKEEKGENSEVNPPFENYPSTYNTGLANRKNHVSESRTRNKPNDSKSFGGKTDRSSRYSDDTQRRSQNSAQDRVDNSLPAPKPKGDIERFKDLGLWLSPEQINEVLGAFINKHKVLLRNPSGPDDSTPLRSKGRSQSTVSETRDSTTSSLSKQSSQYSTELPTTSSTPNGIQSTPRYSDQHEVSSIPPDYYRKRKQQPRTTTIRTITESTIDPPKDVISSQERRKPTRTNPGNRNRSRNSEYHSTRSSTRTSVNPQQEEQRGGSWKSNRTNSTGPLQTTSLRKQNSRLNNTAVRQQSRDNTRSAWQQRTSSRTTTEANPTTTESPRRVKAVEHRRVTKEEIFTRTYIPHGDSEDEQGEESERYEELEPRVEYSTEQDVYEPYESYQQHNGYLPSRGNYLPTQKSLPNNEGGMESSEETKTENYPNFPFNTKEDRKNRDGDSLKVKPKTVSESSSTFYECPGATDITPADPYYRSAVESRSKNVNGDVHKRNRFHDHEFSGVSGSSHVPVTTEGSQKINLGIRDGNLDRTRNVHREKYDYFPRLKSEGKDLELTTQNSHNVNLNRQTSPFPGYEFKRVVDKTIENRKPITEFKDGNKKHQIEHESGKAELDQGKDEEDTNISYRKYSNKKSPTSLYPEDPSDSDTLMYSVDPRTGLGKWSPESPKRVNKEQNRRPSLDYHLPTDSSKLSDYHASSQDTDRRSVNEDSSSRWPHFTRRNRYNNKLGDRGGKSHRTNDEVKLENNTNENSSDAPIREDSKLSGRYTGKRGQYSMKEAADSLYKDYEAQLYQDRGSAPVTERGRKGPEELHVDGGAEASDLTLEHQVYILSKILSSLPPRQRAGVVSDLAKSMQKAVLPTHAVADPAQRMYYYVLPEDGVRSQEESRTLGRRSQQP